jgi:uridine kinase
MAERGRTVDGVVDQYLATVRPMHLEFVESSKRWADIIIPEGGFNTVALDLVISRIMQMLQSVE